LQLRKEQRWQRVTVLANNGQLSRWLEGTDALPESLLESRELAEQVRATLAAIPDEYADVLTAKYLDDVPVEQIAHEERSTETAIRSRLARARQAFRDAFMRKDLNHRDTESTEKSQRECK
jgi:RNA polymerase sigma-70 factor (ECF subfamily)